MTTEFTVLPVLDLKNGEAVHARAGQRDVYRPIETPLAKGSTPDDILAALLALAPFRSVYIADLDAIMGLGGHHAVLRHLAERFPVEFWVDQGLRDAEDLSRVPPALVPVLGSETLNSCEALADALNRLGPQRFVLSLDYRGDTLLGPPGLDTRPELWPERVIAMTLARVGSGGGPDIERLTAIKQQGGTRQIFAAGGVRHRQDLLRLKEIGISGALVATALHDGSLSPTDLKEIQT